jgi:hypothetical protein
MSRTVKKAHMTYQTSTALTTPGPNPFSAFGEAATGPKHAFARFSKGDYVCGRDNDIIATGSEFVMLMDSLTTGFIEWNGGLPGDRIMGRVVEGYVPPRIAELPRRDKSQWDNDERGEPRDPFQLTNEITIVSPTKDKVYTFTTSSRGGLSALGEIAKAYGARMRQYPTQVPLVKLEVNSYMHSNRSFGRIKTPRFAIVDWVEKGQYQKTAGVDTAAGNGNGHLDDPPF